MVVVYAPWCKFCAAMEDEYEAFAADMAAKGMVVRHTLLRASPARPPTAPLPQPPLPGSRTTAR